MKSIITIPWYGLSCLILQQDWFRYSFSKCSSHDLFVLTADKPFPSHDLFVLSGHLYRISEHGCPSVVWTKGPNCCMDGDDTHVRDGFFKKGKLWVGRQSVVVLPLFLLCTWFRWSSCYIFANALSIYCGESDVTRILVLYHCWRHSVILLVLSYFLEFIWLQNQ